MNRHQSQSSKILLLLACVLLHAGAANVSARTDVARTAHGAPFGELIVKVQRLIERRESDPLSNLRVMFVPAHITLHQTFDTQATVNIARQPHAPLAAPSPREALHLLHKYGQAP